MLDRFNAAGVPGQDAAERAFTPSDGIGDIDDDNSEGDDDDRVSDEDIYDHVEDSDGGDDDDTEGYDPGSVNGYQIVMY